MLHIKTMPGIHLAPFECRCSGKFKYCDPERTKGAGKHTLHDIVAIFPFSHKNKPVGLVLFSFEIETICINKKYINYYQCNIIRQSTRSLRVVFGTLRMPYPQRPPFASPYRSRFPLHRFTRLCVRTHPRGSRCNLNNHNSVYLK